MKTLLKRLKISVSHLQNLDSILCENSAEYKRIENILNSKTFREAMNNMKQQIYAGGKSSVFSRQMILGDLIEYIFSGRVYYYASKNEENLSNFLKLILYSVNQLLLFDLISTSPKIRLKFIKKLEKSISKTILYEKEGDKLLANALKGKHKNVKLWDKNYSLYDDFLDSMLPKTLGAPKELIVFAELIRLKIGFIIPLLLIQRILGHKNSIAPPDFLLIKGNKDIYGIELGYEKELQSREFVIKTSIPTFAVDLIDNQFNRCPICGENILYCDPVIELYSTNKLDEKIIKQNQESGRGRKRILKYNCKDCTLFKNGKCNFSNYHGKFNGKNFNGEKIKDKNLHFHTHCIVKQLDSLRSRNKFIELNKDKFFAQIPRISGIDNLLTIG